jgi:hypothetical protein
MLFVSLYILCFPGFSEAFKAIQASALILPPRNVSLEKWFNSIKENEDEEQAETRAVHTGV